VNASTIEVFEYTGLMEEPVASTSPSAPTAGELVDALYATFQAVQTTVQPLLDELNLTEALADVLWQLGEAEAVSRREIAERLKCDPSNVTFLVDRLESRGLVERVAVPGDRRVKAIRLSAEGVSARQRLLSTTDNQSVLATLADADRSELLRLLRLCVSRPSHGAQTSSTSKVPRRTATPPRP
jgi:MarR family transcriptional regulator, organic hydroperoxide resistance regulator